MTKRLKFTAEFKVKVGTGGATWRQDDPGDRIAPKGKRSFHVGRTVSTA